MAAEGLERREQATPKRREEARKKGQVAKSRDLSSALIIMASIGALYFLTPGIKSGLTGLMKELFTGSGSINLTPNNFHSFMLNITYRSLLFLSPLFAILSVAAISSNVLQTGFLISAKPVTPDFTKINLVEGFGKIIRKESLFEFIKITLKIMLVGYVAYVILKGEIPGILETGDLDVNQTIYRFGRVTLRVSLWSGILILIISVFDYATKRWEFEKSLMMTREEIREESRETEGDPLIRSRIRSIQRTMARKRMMSELPKADVVITNPTHLAVALLYEPKKMAAPKVIAKGSGILADRIREMAKEYRIPLVEDKPLAQALYKVVNLGDEIPSNLYKAAAEILAYVYKLKPKNRGIKR